MTDLPTNNNEQKWLKAIRDECWKTGELLVAILSVQQDILKELRKPRDKPAGKTPKRGVKTVEKRNGGNIQGG
jgi:hypothetical protein